MMFGAAIALGFPVEVPVFDVYAHSQTHISGLGKLFSRSFGRSRPAEAEKRCIAPFKHLGRNLDLHRPTVTGVCDKVPHGRRTGLKSVEIVEIKWGQKAIGVDPD